MRALKAGFTLVEVTIALGIISFGLIAILGLLPRGLTLVKESADESAAINILGGITAKLQSKTTPITSSTNVFDAEGNILVATSSPDAIYRAVTLVHTNSPPRMATIQISWPAANAEKPTGTVDAIVSLANNPL